ncbi:MULTISPECIES: helix-hairpin-helix domain-containing protein [unclassified Pseudomonas]|uniref:ComEA family DNA-binding protein n=1 Tax=unclassified Pseudomonas TaxID=196821 RepID=UPI000C8881AA|nr:MULTISPECIES: helix-hairpin-helix domain-containing protein [unclassified Pseudomonas]PNA06101.1 competence protein ComEA [Pseudomonas sp. FW305-BF15]PNB81085.1 competence protein ComEA [Pseudomonas sp. FW305-BF6]
MRTGFFYSLVFALLTSTSIAVIAAPAVTPNVDGTPPVIDVNATSQNLRVDLNNADAATLQKELAGVGEAKAKAIVAYRETNGPFASVDELLEVKGIGKAILDRNRDKLEVN